MIWDIMGKNKEKCPRLAFMCSGNGSNAKAIVNACKRGTLDANPVLLVSNRVSAKALEWGEKYGLATVIAKNETEQLNILRKYEVNWIILSGYLSLIGESIIEAYTKRIVNIHPSLLPRHGGKGMYGIRVHESVIASGDTITGATVHMVSNEIDQGKILGQSTIEVYESDTPESLAERVLHEEHKLFPKVLSSILLTLPMKTCLKCRETKPFSDYGKNRSKKDGLQTYCKECNREYYYYGHFLSH